MNPLVRQKGLTLLEVMMALFIFAITGSAILKAAGDHLSSVGQIEEITFANYVASNRLHQLQATTVWPPTAQRGQMEMAERTWYWQQQVVKTSDEDMRSVTVSVGLKQDYSDTLISVTSFVTQQAGKS